MPDRVSSRSIRCCARSRAQRLLALLATAFAVALTSASASAVAATPAPGFFGLGNWSYPSAGQSAQLGQLGVGSYRAGLVWNDVERQQGWRNWHYVDTLMAGAAQNGYDVVLAINGCAAWACGASRVAPAPGPQQDAFENFVASAVARYGAQGSFWALNPALPRRTVSWQVWNEVNAGADWPNPSPAAYAQLLAATSHTIKAVDPSATVVMSGLTERPANGSGASLTDFLNGLYAQPGFAASFDVAAVHGYADGPAGVARILDSARRIMASNGDGAKPLWITEMGWASGGPPHPFSTDDAGQASKLTASFGQLVGCRARWNLTRALWFSTQDIDAAMLGEADYWGVHTGLLNADGSAKPALGAFAQFTSGQPLPGGLGDRCDLPGGNRLEPTAPETILAAPAAAKTTTAGVGVRFAATQTDSTFECSIDKAKWKSCRRAYRVRVRRLGKHSLRVRAVNVNGVADATPATATWTVGKAPARASKRRAKEARTLRASAVAGYRCRTGSRAWARCAGAARAALMSKAHRRVVIRARNRRVGKRQRASSLAFRVLR